ncbi:MAG: hypothetical protein R6V62_08155 [Candidatus Fermentibacteraceae bacterium]
MNTPEQIAGELKSFLSGRHEVIAAWEGGSAATGYLDSYSDLDLAVVCRDDSVEAVISLLDEFLTERYGILKRLRMPEPAWHGFSQIFYLLSETPEFYYLDVAFIRRSVPDKFTACDRHGYAVVWFEKELMVDPAPTPSDLVLTKARKFYATALEQGFVLEIEVGKALARERLSEAFSFYYQFLVRNLGVMLNLKYRPQKVDFGLRYAYRDYSPEDSALVDELLLVKSSDDLRVKFRKARDRYSQLVDEMSCFGEG